MKRTFLILGLLVFLGSSPALAALSGVVAGTFDQDTNADPWNFTVNTVAGDNLLVVACHVRGSATIDGVTHNGDAMTVHVTADNGAVDSKAFIATG